MQWEEGRRWQMKQWDMGRAGCGQGGGGGSAWGRKRDKSCIHIAWNGDIHIAHPPPSLPEVPRYIPGVMLNYPQRQAHLSLCLSYLCLSLTIHPSREHQQRFCPGLHQRVPDGERPVGQRKPTLFSRIHSHCQGELLNGRQLFHQCIKRELLNQCSVWVWWASKRPAKCGTYPISYYALSKYRLL